MKKIKVSELPEELNTTGLYVLGTNAQNVSVKVPLALVVVAEAPLNDKVYGRKNGTWFEIEVTGIPDAPLDGEVYGRLNGDWVKVALPSDITEAIAVEAERAQGVENELSDLLQSLSESVTGLSSGKQDKTDNTLQTISKTIVGAINELKNAISTEAERANDAESALGGRIDTADAAISAEVTRATGAESALGLRIDGVSGDITAEETARAAADTALGLRIDGKGDAPTTKTAWESDNTPVDNTIYNLGTMAALTIAATPTGNSMGVAIYFASGATATTFSYPVTTKWVLSEAPTIEANKEYCITILDGVYNCIEVTTLTHN